MVATALVLIFAQADTKVRLWDTLTVKPAYSLLSTTTANISTSGISLKPGLLYLCTKRHGCIEMDDFQDKLDSILDGKVRK